MKHIKAQIPNLLTLANLFCGLLIIIVSSPMGKELDSMADMVSFGVAPALVLYNYWNNEMINSFTGWIDDKIYLTDMLPYVPLLIAVFAGYRLAKFNVEEQNNDYFSGLPTPALALGCFALPLAAEQFRTANFLLTSPVFIITFSLLGGLLLISNVKLFSIKIGSNNKQLNFIRVVMIITCIVLIAWLHFFGAFLCLFVYLGFSLTSQKIIT